MFFKFGPGLLLLFFDDRLTFFPYFAFFFQPFLPSLLIQAWLRLFFVIRIVGLRRFDNFSVS